MRPASSRSFFTSAVVEVPMACVLSGDQGRKATRARSAHPNLQPRRTHLGGYRDYTNHALSYCFHAGRGGVPAVPRALIDGTLTVPSSAARLDGRRVTVGKRQEF